MSILDNTSIVSRQGVMCNIVCASIIQFRNRANEQCLYEKYNRSTIRQL